MVAGACLLGSFRLRSQVNSCSQGPADCLSSRKERSTNSCHMLEVSFSSVAVPPRSVNCCQAGCLAPFTSPVASRLTLSVSLETKICSSCPCGLLASIATDFGSTPVGA